MLAFALTIFTGAFLLFQVQPLIGKYILPWFGGGPGVWTTCMLFFQVLLLGGYAYAHFASRHLKPRKQAVLHMALLLVALCMLPIIPADKWKPLTSGDPTWRILALLTASLGLPYLALSATGPLMQEWFRRTQPGASPYRLYALSNVGSLLALISYPFYFEINFARHTQAAMWSWGLVFYVACAGWCAWRLWQTPETPAGEQAAADAGAVTPTWGTRLLWLALPACASIMLVAITNKMCQDVAVIPFLWVLPLALYLLTFIICFDSPRWYSRFYFTLALVAAVINITLALYKGTDFGIIKQVIIYSGGMFVGCMVCHGELYALKPHPKFLTSFYLMISAGGALGGLFVAVIAPLIFNNYYELHVSLCLAILLLLIVCYRSKETLTPAAWRILFYIFVFGAAFGSDRAIMEGVTWLKDNYASWNWTAPDRWNWVWVGRVHWLAWAAFGVYVLMEVRWHFRQERRNWHSLACAMLMMGLYSLGVALVIQARVAMKDSLSCARNFYGVLSVFEYRKESPEGHYYLLQHGKITHGLQFSAPSEAGMLTTYYGEKSGVGMAIRHFPRQENQRIGLVGLGTGTVSAYGKAGDYIRIYEINPYVEHLAKTRFTYLTNSKAKVEVALGDARLSMEKEPSQQFDILALDAFSSDAIPVHLLTKEAIEIYQRHLKPDGVLAIHISNRYLNLEPVVYDLAREFNYKTATISNDEEEEAWWIYSATWVLLTKNDQLLAVPEIVEANKPEHASKIVGLRLWTDDYASLFKILQRD